MGVYRVLSGRNSAVECQLPKLDVAGSIPVARSNLFNGLHVRGVGLFCFRAQNGITSKTLLGPGSPSIPVIEGGRESGLWFPCL